MNNLLIKLFIKDRENIQDEKVRLNYGKFASIVGIISNILLFGIKFSIGTLFFSVSIVADAINNLADSASSLITLVGFKLSAKPADEQHPFGHARIEYICGIIVSFIIMIIGFELFQSSFDKILNPVMPQLDIIVFVSLVISLALKFWQSQFYKKIAKKINSKALFATSTDSRNDCFSTLSVLVGAVFMKFLNLNIDGYLGLALAIFIVYSGFKLVIETSQPLLGEAPDQAMISAIREKVLSYEGIIGIHDLMVHSYGSHKNFASLHCEVDSSEELTKSHDLMDNIEHDFKKNLGIDMVLHMDPIDTKNPKTQELKKEISEKLSSKFLGAHIHDFRVVWGREHSNVVFDVSVPFSEKTKDSQIEIEVNNIINTIDKSYRPVVTVERGM
ncbi:MAG: cation diffusion facilitator family transporter [Clostridia bacterium]